MANATLENDTSVLEGASGPGGNLHPAVEVDSSPNESDYESSEYSTATTSVASSVFSFTYANGRRYHSDRFKNQYFMPNDESEQDRLDLYHHIFLLILGGKLFTAPVDNPQKVLDVGTGTGIWAIDFADENQQAEVTAVDISPIQPSWVPPNCRFEIDDLEETWTFKDNYFDYIHMRSMGGSFKDWSSVLDEAYNKLAPGGYIEIQDYSPQPYLCDGTKLTGEIPEHPLATYMHLVMKASENRGILLDMAPQAKTYLQKAGFVDIVEKVALWPVGHWPKEKRLKNLGRYCRIGSEQSAFPFAVALLRNEGWSVDQVQDLCDQVVGSYKKMDQPGTTGKYYFQAWFIYGRKPLPEEKESR